MLGLLIVHNDNAPRRLLQCQNCLKIQPATGSFARNLIYSTKPLYDKVVDLDKRRDFLIDWFRSVLGNGKGARKVDSAIKLFDGTLNFRYPPFLDEVFDFA